MVSYTAVSPLPTCVGGLFSVALSRGLLRVGVTHRPALWSPDVPRCGCPPRDRPTDPFARPILRACAPNLESVTRPERLALLGTDELDTRPLRDPIDRAARRAYAKSMPTGSRPPLAPAIAPAAIFALIGLGLPVMFAFILSSGEAEPDAWAEAWEDLGIWWITMVPMYLMAAVSAWLVVRTLIARNPTRPYRFDRFARANRMSYAPVSAGFRFSGLIFQQGTGLGRNIFRADASALTLGSYQFTTGSGRSQKTQTWGFVAIPLPRALPHIVLDARGNNALRSSNLPIDFDRDQQLDLEGDFNKHFTLYCPRGYETDALYLFTPDIMARFVDHAAELDVEIVDDRMFLYSRKPLVSLDPEVWDWLFATIEALTAKVDQWENWRDDRLGATRVVGGIASPEIIRPPLGVAREGRRLTSTPHWIWTVIGFIALPIGLWGLGSAVVDIVTDVISFVRDLLAR